MKKRILAFILSIVSIFAFAFTARADGDNGRIKIYANVMEEKNFPISFFLFKEGEPVPMKKYVLSKDNDWKVEDSVPAGNYEVKAGMKNMTNFKIAKSPFKRKIEVKQGQLATNTDDGLFTIVQCWEDDYNDYEVYLYYQTEKGEFLHGEHTLSDAKMLKEDLLKRQNVGSVLSDPNLHVDEDKLKRASDKYYEEKVKEIKDAEEEKKFREEHFYNPESVEGEGVIEATDEPDMNNSQVPQGDTSSGRGDKKENNKEKKVKKDKKPFFLKDVTINKKQKAMFIILNALVYSVMTYFIIEKRKNDNHLILKRIMSFITPAMLASVIVTLITKNSNVLFNMMFLIIVNVLTFVITSLIDKYILRKGV